VFEEAAGAETLSGIPGVMEVNGELHLFGCGPGIAYGVSGDGLEFENRGEVFHGNQDNPLICDPSPVRLEDGSFAMVVKQLLD
jgi:hypothetical protein